jgi:hypothetical protein
MKAYANILIAAIALSACGQPEATNTERSEVGGNEYTLPVPESELPEIQLEQWDINEPELNLASSKDDIKQMMKDAAKKIEEGYYSGNNLFVAAGAFSVSTQNGKEQCIKIQVQQRKSGKLIVKDEFVPAGQAEECTITGRQGLGLATLGLLVKVGNNYAGGIGVGALYFDGTYAVGCAAGAVGYILETGAAWGTAGGFCTKLVNVTTGQTY